MQLITLATALLGCSTVIAVPTAASEDHVLQKRSPRVKSIICDKYPVRPDDLMKNWPKVKHCEDVYGPNKVRIGAKCWRSIFIDVQEVETFKVTLHVWDTTMINKVGVTKELTITKIEWVSNWYDEFAIPDLQERSGQCQWHH